MYGSRASPFTPLHPLSALALSVRLREKLTRGTIGDFDLPGGGGAACSTHDDRSDEDKKRGYGAYGSRLAGEDADIHVVSSCKTQYQAKKAAEVNKRDNGGGHMYCKSGAGCQKDHRDFNQMPRTPMGSYDGTIRSTPAIRRPTRPQTPRIWGISKGSTLFLGRYFEGVGRLSP